MERRSRILSSPSAEIGIQRSIRRVSLTRHRLALHTQDPRAFLRISSANAPKKLRVVVKNRGSL